MLQSENLYTYVVVLTRYTLLVYFVVLADLTHHVSQYEGISVLRFHQGQGGSILWIIHFHISVFP